MPISQYRKNVVRGRCRNRCVYCGTNLKTSDAHIDHVIPKSAGGTSAVINLVLSCPRCNGLKGDLTVPEFREKIRLRLEHHRSEARHMRAILKNMGT